MTTLTISLAEKSHQRLRELSEQFSLSPEELVRASIEELLARPEEDFRQTLDYVLKKNAELYRLLA